MAAQKMTGKKVSLIRYGSWARGLNTLVSPTKIRNDELAVANNVLLTSLGSPARRWGSNYYGNSSPSGQVTGMFSREGSDGARRLIKIKGGIGYYYTESTGNWSPISGASFASTSLTRYATQINDILYISDGYNGLTKYNGLGFSRFTTLSTPTGLSVTRGASLISGQSQVSYRITATNDVGETLASTAATAQVDRPRDEWNFDSTAPNSNYSVLLSWTATASATGYNIYGVDSGFETFIDSVDSGSVTSYRDYGLKIPSTLFSVPVGNTTDAPKFKYVISYKSSLLGGGDPSNPSRLYYSAGVDKPDSFLIGDGGGFIDVNKNANDGFITGLGVFQNSAIIFKERSIWKFDFTESQIPTLANVNKGLGCISHNSIVPVENDVFFVGRKIGGGVAIYVLGNEPNFLNQLRTNELSARIRPELRSVQASSFEKICATYVDGKYIVAYPEGGSGINNRAIVYDRERLGFTKWEDIYMDFSQLFYDANNGERILFVDPNDTRVTELSESYTNDKGTPISWEYRTRQEDFGDTFNYNIIKWLNFQFRDVNGLNNIRVWHDNTYTDLSLNIQGTLDETALRALKLRVGKLRRTLSSGESVPEDIVVRRIPFSRSGSAAVTKTLGISVSGNTLTSKATLLDLSIESKQRSKRFFNLSEVYQI